jgi:pimeloyl-ACP methyl ester carboxylesterase
LNHRIFRQEGAEEWIVFLHGLGGTSSIWFKQIHRFAREYNLLLIDLRGHGGSREAYTGSYSFQAMARDVLDVMDSLGLGR